MRTVVVVGVAICAVVATSFVPRGSSAPALGDRPARFEYAEVTFTRSIKQPAAQPGAAQARPIETTKVRWTTADEDVEADGWDELAAKLKAPAAKKEASDSQHQLRVFNRLGADGWEFYERSTGNRGLGNMTAWSFKRRLP